jgi:hypothetical protein
MKESGEDRVKRNHQLSEAHDDTKKSSRIKLRTHFYVTSNHLDANDSFNFFSKIHQRAQSQIFFFHPSHSIDIADFSLKSFKNRFFYRSRIAYSFLNMQLACQQQNFVFITWCVPKNFATFVHSSS